MHYRRAKTPGATYFFTVVTLFHTPETIAYLRQAFRNVKANHPSTIEAIKSSPYICHAASSYW